LDWEGGWDDYLFDLRFPTLSELSKEKFNFLSIGQLKAKLLWRTLLRTIENQVL
jgi:hypothetical protein